jgi:hypothetical protein
VSPTTSLERALITAEVVAHPEIREMELLVALVDLVVEELEQLLHQDLLQQMEQLTRVAEVVAQQVRIQLDLLKHQEQVVPALSSSDLLAIPLRR